MVSTMDLPRGQEASASPDPGHTARLARQSVGYGLGRLATIGLQVLLVAGLARALGAEGYGALAAGLALTAVIDALAEFGLLHTSIVAMGTDPGAARRLAAIGTRASVATLLVAVVVAAPVLLGYSSEARWAVACLLPAVVVQRLCTGHVALRRHRLQLVRLNGAEVAGRVVTTVLAVPALLGARSVEAQLALVGVAYLVGALVTAVLVRTGSEGRARTATADVRALVLAALPLGVTGGLSLVHVRADQVLLEMFGRQGELATYALGYRAIESLVGILAIASGAAFAYLANTDPASRRVPASRALRQISLLGFLGAAVLFGGADLVGRALGAGELADAGTFVRLLAPVAWLSAVNMLAAQVCIVAGQQRWLLRVAAGATVLNVGLGLAVIPVAGAGGAALGTLLTEALVVGATLRRARRGGLLDPTPVTAEAVALVVAVVAAVLVGVDTVAAPVGTVVGLIAAVAVVVRRRSDLADVGRLLRPRTEVAP